MGMNISKMNEKMHGIFEFAELEKFRNVKLKNFSSGMYARLAFATAIASDPDIFLIDEALSVGDEAFQRKCVTRIEKFQQSGKTIIFVSHSADLVKKICKKCVLLENGCVVDYGYSDSVIDKYHARISDRSRAKEIEHDAALEGDEQGAALEYVEAGLPERFGTMEAEIEKIQLLDKNYKPIGTIKECDELIIRLLVKFNSDVDSPVFGIRILDDDKVDVYTTNTKWQKIECGNFKAGNHVIVDFKQRINLLSGKYLLDTAIVSYEFTDFLDIQFNVDSFDVENSVDATGIVNLKSNIKIKFS